MTQRLPTPGSDDGTWGTILNDYLTVSHNADGTLKSAVVIGAIPAGSVTSTQLDSGTQTALTKATSSVQSVNSKTPTTGNVNIGVVDLTDTSGISGATDNQVLAYSQSSGKWIPANVTNTPVTDATTGAKGILQLTGDLTGTATNPAVAGGAITSAKIASGTIVDANIASGAAIVKSKLANLGIVDNDVATSGLTTTKIADSTDKRYVTDAQRIVLTNTSGTNTGDQDLSGLVPKVTTVNGHALSSNVTVTASDLGLGNVNNTSDANKPVSTATQSALNLKAPLASPTFTGTVTVPTPTNNTDATTKGYIDAHIVATTSVHGISDTSKLIVGDTAHKLSVSATQPSSPAVNDLWVDTTSGAGVTTVAGPAAWSAPAAWSSSTSYVAGPPASAVTYKGSTFVALASSLNVSPSSDVTKWQEVTQGFNFRGAWAGTTAYLPYDVVTNSGSTYMATTSFTSGASFNPANWTVLAQASSGTPLDSSLTLAAIGKTSPVATGQAADSGHTHANFEWMPSDHGFVTWSFPPTSITNTNALTNGTAAYVLVKVPVAGTFSNVVMQLTNTPAGLVNCYVQVYQNNVSLGFSADLSSTGQGNWATSGNKSIPIGAGNIAYSAGTLQIVLWCSTSTTAPSFARGGNQYSVVNSGPSLSTNPRFATITMTGAPTTSNLGAVSASSTAYWVALD